MCDLISRSALYKDIERRPYIDKALAEIFWTIIDEQPTVEAKPVIHGEWIPEKEMLRSPYALNYHCSECGKLNYLTDFCPHCGADMRKKENKCKQV